MNLSKRLNMLEKAIDGQGPQDDGIDPPNWREVEARRLLPLLRWTALNTRYEDMPLPDDETLIQQEVGRLQHFDSLSEYRRVPQMPDAMLDYFTRENESRAGFSYI